MLTLKLKTPQDLKEAATIEYRRRWEEERKKRIFNARERILGVDFAALDDQIKEKKKLQEIADEHEKKLINETLRRNEVIRNKERELNAERRRIQQEINEYRATFQRPEDAREFDLNDPNYVQNCAPARVNDGDSRLGISSAQIFLGEDLLGKERKKAQNEQQRLWLEQQIRERQNAESARKKADSLLMEALVSRDRRALELDAQERSTRKKIQQEMAEFNFRLAAEQESKRLEMERENEEDNLAAMYNNLTSDMMTENKECTSNFGPHRKITTDYRGLSDQEIKHIRDEQYNQAVENQKQKAAAQLQEAQWEQHSKNVARTVLLKQRQEQRDVRNQLGAINEENRLMAEEQRSQQQYFDKVVYTNRPTADYFAQFNTTSR